MDNPVLFVAVMIAAVVVGQLIGFVLGRGVQRDADARETEKLQQRWNGKLQSARWDFVRKIYEPAAYAVMRDPVPFGQPFKHWRYLVGYLFEHLVGDDPVGAETMVEGVNKRLWHDDKDLPVLRVEQLSNGNYIVRIGSPWVVLVFGAESDEEPVLARFPYWFEDEVVDWGHKGIALVANAIPAVAKVYCVISPYGKKVEEGKIEIYRPTPTEANPA